MKWNIPLFKSYWDEDDIKAVEKVITNVKELDLPEDFESSLTSKLEDVNDALDEGQNKTAINILNALIKQIEAQQGKKLTEDEADALIKDAQTIIIYINNI